MGNFPTELVMFILIIIPLIVVVASMWVLFQKAGTPGWSVIVPVYGSIVMAEIIKKPWYWGILMILPYIGWIWAIWSLNLFVKSFGKDTGYTIGCIFLPFIFLPMLAFNSNTKYLYNENEDGGNSSALDHGVR